jgi:Dolichyl-phosphate-mannose-protein mannosyltransferase
MCIVSPQPPSKRAGLICLTIVVVVFGVRLLHWQNDFLTLDKNMTRLNARYKEEAQFLLNGDLASFIKGARSQPDTMILSHPPGYPLVIATIYKLSGNSDRALRVFQIACEAVTAVLVFLIAARLVPRGAAVVAALLVAVAPQLAYRSLVLLPDTLSALPLVAAIFLTTKAVEDRSISKWFLAGVLIGVSAWLRPDSVLLQFFLCAALMLLFPRGQRLRPALALIGGAVLIIAPITIRNVLVFHSFVPFTLGTGQNLSAGIGDYDVERRFGLSSTDDGTCLQEAEWFGRPDYKTDLYRPDGIERDRGRTARALAVIRKEPLWFVGTMFRRVAAMLEYEPVSIISAEPTVSHSLEITSDTPLVWSRSSHELLTEASGSANTSVTEAGLRLEADGTANATQLVTKPIALKRNFDYVLTIPLSFQQGQLAITVRPVGHHRIIASASLPDSLERVPYTNAYAHTLQIPFVNTNAEPVQIVIANVDATAQRAIVDVGRIELHELGPASYLWTRYPRLLVKSFQKQFVTGKFLPLTIVGVVLLAVYRRKVALALLLTVPIYYLASHAPIHFEYRYLLPAYFFGFILAGLAIYWIAVMCARVVLWLGRAVRFSRSANA